MGRKLGVFLLWAGFLSGSLISVREHGAIDWVWYGVAAIVTMAGIVAIRVGQRRGLSEGGRVAREIEKLRESLDRVRQGVDGLHDGAEMVNVYDVHTRIDSELMPSIAEFVDARESMIEAFGLETYAKVMTDFALAERLLNRAWCASADGYIDEVWASVGRARAALERAHTVLPARE